MSKKLKTVNIKGKEYVEVNERIRHFRENYPEGSIVTELVSNNGGVCVFKAIIYNMDQIVATGHAYEKEGSTFINKTSYIENCETSAIGRALGILGIGIDGSVASAEEVKNAIANQDQGDDEITLTPKQINDSLDLLRQYEEMKNQTAARAIFKKANYKNIVNRHVIINEAVKHFPKWEDEIV